jgi:hypothetical protein
MRKFIIERELPAIGSAERQALREAAQKSNATLKELGSDIQWVESYVANDKTFASISLGTRRLSRSTPSAPAFRPTRSPKSAA